jgi:hypothetical protein
MRDDSETPSGRPRGGGRGRYGGHTRPHRVAGARLGGAGGRRWGWAGAQEMGAGGGGAGAAWGGVGGNAQGGAESSRLGEPPCRPTPLPPCTPATAYGQRGASAELGALQGPNRLGLRPRPAGQAMFRRVRAANPAGQPGPAVLTRDPGVAGPGHGW